MGKCNHKWRVIRTIWPYPDGYGTQCKKCKMLLDSGLPRWQAEDIVENELNAKKGRTKKWSLKRKTATT